MSYLGLDGLGSYLGRGKRFSLLHNRPDRLQGPPSLLFNGYRRYIPVLKPRAVMLTTFPYLVSRLRSGAELLILLCGQERLYFVFTRGAYFDTFCFEQNQAKKEYAAGLSSAAVFPMRFLSFLGRKAESRTVVYSVEVKLSLSTP